MTPRPAPAVCLRRLLLGCLTALVLLTGCGPTSFLITPVPARQDLEEHVVASESFWATRKIALVEVEGTLQNGRPLSLLGTGGENPVALFTEKLEQAANDDSVKAVVLRINSPGGTVTASDLMYAEVLRFRAESGKPVIAAMMDIAASGGYYVACAADKIYAHPTTITGSIGVIMLTPEFSGTMAKIGAEVNVIKSGQLKDMGSLFRPMEPSERAVFQGLIDGMYERFLAVVGRNRTALAADDLRRLADGRVYLGTQAREAGLVDELGDLRTALAAAKTAAGLDDKPVKVIEYARPVDYRPNIYAQAGPPPTQAVAPTQVNLINLNLPDWFTGSPQLMYLWAPGW